MEGRGEGEQGVQTDSAYHLEDGARTRVLQRLNVLVFRSYCHGLSHRASHAPAQLWLRAGRSDIMMLGVRASVFSGSLLLQPRSNDHVYRWDVSTSEPAIFTLAEIALCRLARLMVRQDAPLSPST